MQTRSARPSGRMRVAGLAAAVALGLGTALLGASPALAAAPTLDPNPTPPVGWDWVTLTGTADPGADVVLWERAYSFRDLPSEWVQAVRFFPEDIITAKADTSGHFTLRRRLDSGFQFRVEANGTSNVINVPMVAKPFVQFDPQGGGTVGVVVQSEPGQAWLPVTVQRRNGENWMTVAEGSIPEAGAYSTTLTGEPAGTQYYRVGVGPDAGTLVDLGYSAVISLDTGGTGTPTTAPTTTPPTTRPTTTPPTTTPTTTPPTTRPTTTPPTTRPTTTPPTTRPTTTAPTVKPTPTPTKPPAPKPPVYTGPKWGDVQFTYAYYNSKGSDTGSNASLNGEYVRLTNKTSKTINLKYWTVRDKAGNTYRFSGDFHLRPGKHVYLRTGKGKNTSTTRYWGRKSYVWNNTGDTAYVRTGGNKLIDYCGWRNGKGYTSC